MGGAQLKFLDRYRFDKFKYIFITRGDIVTVSETMFKDGPEHDDWYIKFDTKDGAKGLYLPIWNCDEFQLVSVPRSPKHLATGQEVAAADAGREEALRAQDRRACAKPGHRQPADVEKEFDVPS